MSIYHPSMFNPKHSPSYTLVCAVTEGEVAA